MESRLWCLHGHSDLFFFLSFFLFLWGGGRELIFAGNLQRFCQETCLHFLNLNFFWCALPFLEDVEEDSPDTGFCPSKLSEQDQHMLTHRHLCLTRDNETYEVSNIRLVALFDVGVSSSSFFCCL